MRLISRFRHIAVIALMSLLMTTPLAAQNPGTTPLERDAAEFTFQYPEAWSGSRYTTPHSLLDRLYVAGGASITQTWNNERELDSSDNQLGLRLGLGVRLAPVHSLEFGTSLSGIEASYLFNLSSYGERTEEILPFEFSLRGGVDYEFGTESSAHMFGGLRMRYNFTPTFSLYLEPGLGVCGYAAEGSGYVKGDVSASVQFGMGVNLGRMVMASRETMSSNRAYWDANNLSDRRVLLTVKSNLLYDIALIPNIEFEIAIKERWSLGAQVLCGWWLKSDNSRCWQIQAADIEGRYWFGDRSRRRELTGWFAGLFASGGFYDFQIKETRGLQGEFYVLTGVSGGYSLPIGRRMNLELAAGVGYIVNNYQRYVVYEEEYLVADGDLMRFQSLFPAKVEVSLGWLLFGGGNDRESRRVFRSNNMGGRK